MELKSPIVEFTLLLLTWLSLIAPFILPFILENKRRKKFPETRPYRWGYFIGFCSIAVAFSLLDILISRNLDFFSCSIVSAVIAIYFLLGFFIIKRKRWAVVIGTILTLNPIIWICNIFYLKKRWREFTAEAHGTPQLFYHGTAATESFQILKANSWLTLIPQHAIEFAKEGIKSENGIPRIVVVKANFNRDTRKLKKEDRNERNYKNDFRKEKYVRKSTKDLDVVESFTIEQAEQKFNVGRELLNKARAM